MTPNSRAPNHPSIPPSTNAFYLPSHTDVLISIKPEKITDENIVVEEDTNLWINTMAIHFDSKNFSNPYNFDPEHLSPESKAKKLHKF